MLNITEFGNTVDELSSRIVLPAEGNRKLCLQTAVQPGYIGNIANFNALAIGAKAATAFTLDLDCFCQTPIAKDNLEQFTDASNKIIWNVFNWCLTPSALDKLKNGSEL